MITFDVTVQLCSDWKFVGSSFCKQIIKGIFCSFILMQNIINADFVLCSCSISKIERG